MRDDEQDAAYLESLMDFGAAIVPEQRGGRRAARQMQIEWFNDAVTAAMEETPDPLIGGLFDVAP